MNQEEALKWIADLFEEPENKLTPDSPREAIPAWDSLGVLTLMAVMDERFGIFLGDADLRAMTKVDHILDVLRKNGKLSD